MLAVVVLPPLLKEKAQDSVYWCPKIAVTIDSVLTSGGHVNAGLLPDSTLTRQALVKRPFVRLAEVTSPKENPIKYEGYVVSSPSSNDRTSLLEYQRTQEPLCVAFVYNGSSFVLFEPLKLK